jgi:hypothetical protein
MSVAAAEVAVNKNAAKSTDRTAGFGLIGVSFSLSSDLARPVLLVARGDPVNGVSPHGSWQMRP